MFRSAFVVLWILAVIGPAAGEPAPDQRLDEILVTATLRPIHDAAAPQSITVLNQQTLRTAGVQHFEDVLMLIPNLNWAAGTSLPRFFQLRGVGEVEEYQGAPNPSVGFLIDEIDFSGIGMPATLFDTAQIEVLRGPQGTTYGANALAGLIHVRTAEPGRHFELNSELTGAQYGTRAAGAVIGDGREDGTLGWRFVAQRYVSDGFRHNAYSGRNTNDLDEGTVRAKIHWSATDDLTVDAAFIHSRINNGYDAWSINNTFTTYSDHPGRDTQLSDGAAVRVQASLGPVEVQSITSGAESQMLYSFDGDWGNDAYWKRATGFSPYDYFQSDHRTRHTVSQDLRLLSPAGRPIFGYVRWLAGIYASRLIENDSQSFVWHAYDAGVDGGSGAGHSELTSQYGASNVAVYGSLDADICTHSVLSIGLRVEERNAHYDDTADSATPFPRQRNRMMGGNLSWTRRVDRSGILYLTLGRGFNGGGFNIGSGILAEQREFGPEALWSVEAGVKWVSFDSRLSVKSGLFYMRRQHMQVYSSQQLQSNNPLNYVFYTQNVRGGDNYGMEQEVTAVVSSRWLVSVSASLLKTRYLVGSDLVGALGISGRSQPYSPSYKAAASIEYRHPSGLFARLSSSAMGGFYYYTSDAQASMAHHLEDIRVGYERNNWVVSAWIRNVLDARYGQSGFYFGLIPPNFPNQAFVQLGNPRQIGITLNYKTNGRS